MDGWDQFDIHPEMQALLDAKRVATATDIAVQRSRWDAYDAALRRDYPADMSVVDRQVRAPGVGGELSLNIRIYRPGRAAAASACIVYIHGGAFIKGSIDSGDPIAWGVAEETGCVVVSLDYGLAPDAPFPRGLEDCYALVRLLAAEGEAFGIDPGRIALWGDSAGGNLAAAVCLLARDRGGPRIVAQAINYSCLTDELTTPSYEAYAEAPVTTASMDRAWSLYLGDGRPTANGYAAPLKAGDLSGLPPAHVHYAEIDCLADDSVRYGERLREAGNRVVVAEAKGMIHGYLRARFCGPDSAAEFRKPCAFLMDALSV